MGKNPTLRSVRWIPLCLYDQQLCSQHLCQCHLRYKTFRLVFVTKCCLEILAVAVFVFLGLFSVCAGPYRLVIVHLLNTEKERQREKKNSHTLANKIKAATHFRVLPGSDTCRNCRTCWHKAPHTQTHTHSHLCVFNSHPPAQNIKSYNRMQMFGLIVRHELKGRPMTQRQIIVIL